MQFADFLNVAILAGVVYAVKLLLDLKAVANAMKGGAARLGAINSEGGSGEQPR